MKKTYFTFITVCVLFFFSNLTWASNLSFLNYSSVAYFEGKDEAMMNANADLALNQYPDGKKATWKNPATGSWGFAIPSQTRTQQGRTCRNLKIFNNASSVTGEFNYRLCKFGTEWKIVGP